jgi:glycine/serine hydroxymethyltransferase
MKEPEMAKIAAWMDDVVKNIDDEVALDHTAVEVAEFCRSYPPPGLESD